MKRRGGGVLIHSKRQNKNFYNFLSFQNFDLKMYTRTLGPYLRTLIYNVEYKKSINLSIRIIVLINKNSEKV